MEKSANTEMKKDKIILRFRIGIGGTSVGEYEFMVRVCMRERISHRCIGVCIYTHIDF